MFIASLFLITQTQLELKKGRYRIRDDETSTQCMEDFGKVKDYDSNMAGYHGGSMNDKR